MKWKRTDKVVSNTGTTIIYECEYPGIRIESRLRHVPHANGEGTWDHTSYFVIEGNPFEDDIREKERYTLKDAKKQAEEWISERSC